MTRALIMAGGTDAKWGDHLGVRRHFAPVCHETVITRMIRQLRARGVTDIGIIAPDLPGYAIEGTYRIEPTYAEWGHEALNGRAEWSTTGRTIQVYGDVVFSDKAMDTIAGYRHRVFRAFGRHGRGAIKGGELFAISFWPEQCVAWEKAQRLGHELHARGIIKRSGSWEGYRIMGGARKAGVGRHRIYPQIWTEINDGTDDFDKPLQYEALIALVAKLGW